MEKTIETELGADCRERVLKYFRDRRDGLIENWDMETVIPTWQLTMHLGWQYKSYWVRKMLSELEKQGKVERSKDRCSYNIMMWSLANCVNVK